MRGSRGVRRERWTSDPRRLGPRFTATVGLLERLAPVAGFGSPKYRDSHSYFQDYGRQHRHHSLALHNKWDWAFVGPHAFHYKFPHIVTGLLTNYLTLFCWSWTTGFLVGALSRRAIHVNSALFCVMLSLPLQVFDTPFAREYNAAVFAVTFYRWYLPWIGQALLVLLPALWGMRHGIRLGAFRPLLRATLWMTAAAGLAPIVLGGAFSLPVWLRMHRPVLYWPVAYLVAYAIGQRWRPPAPEFALQNNSGKPRNAALAADSIRDLDRTHEKCVMLWTIALTTLMASAARPAPSRRGRDRYNLRREPRRCES